MVNVGTPDWQRGIVTAGKLLGAFPYSQTSAVVNIPPNAESLIVVVPGSVSPGTLSAVGVTTSMQYPGTKRLGLGTFSTSSMFLFNVSSSLDAQITLSWSGFAEYDWWAYSDNASMIVDVPGVNALTQSAGYPQIDQGILSMGVEGQTAHVIEVDANGRQIPLVPTLGKLVTVAAGTTQILAAPTSVHWYLFGIDVSITGGTTTPVTLIDSAGNTIAYDDPPSGGESHSIDLQGFATLGSVSIVTTAGATVVLRYAPGP